MLAGGLGSRMRPLTDNCPKPLLPLGAEPLVAYQLRRLAAVGVGQVVLATGYLAPEFERVLGDGQRWGVRLGYSVERQPLGTGGALRAAGEHLPDADRVVVVNGDLLSSHDLTAQLRSAPGADVCLHVRAVPDVAPYGQVTCDAKGRVTAFGEKTGRGPGLANAGTNIVAGAVLRALREGRSSWERDLLPALIAGDTDVVAWEGDGYFRDVGSCEAYRRASVDAVTGALPNGSCSAADAYVAPGASVAADARLTGGSSIHEGAVVGSGAVVCGSVVLAGARIGAGARLDRCVVASGAVVPAGGVGTDDVIGGIPTLR